MPVHVDHPWRRPAGRQGEPQEQLGRDQVAFGRPHEPDGLAGRVDRAIQIGPLACNLNIRLVDAPGTLAIAHLAMPVEMLLDYLAIQLNGPKAEGKTLRIALNFSDAGERHLLALENSVLNHWKDRAGAECTVTLTREHFSSILVNHANL